MTDSTDPAPRITDLSSIEPENFKFRNTQFLRADGHHYDNPHDESFLEQRKEIWRVRNGDLERVLEEFPTDRPLPEQCALDTRARGETLLPGCEPPYCDRYIAKAAP